ncbi:MAG: AsmA family protein [Wenzhouxiangellaceae bacterium]|nr:AsmA family protein [Wenzhouxiangellaceae bacterium]
MRALLIFVAAVVVIILGLWATLVLYFDEARLKQIATEQVRAQTGRELVINGPLKLKVFPRISLVANDVALSGPEDYTGPGLFRADEFRMSLSLMPLLRGNVETGDIALEQAELNIHTDRSGRSTLDGLAGSSPPAESEPSVEGAEISTGTIRLESVRLVLSDAAADTREVFVIDRLRIESFSFDQAVPFQFEGALGDPALVDDIDLSGSLTVPSGTGPVRVDGLSLNADYSGMTLGLSGDATVEMGPPLIASFSEGSLKLGDNEYTVAFAYTDGDRPKIDATMQGQRLDVDSLLAAMPAAQAEADEQAESPLLIFRDIDLDADLTLDEMIISGLTLSSIRARMQAENGLVSIDPLAGALQGGRIDAVAMVDLNAEPPEIEFSPVFDLENLGQALSAWGLDQYLAGSGALVLDFSARGLDVDSILSTLNGQGSYDFRNGLVKGLNLDGMVDALASRNITQAVSSGIGGTTEFKTFAGEIVVTDGTIRLPGLKLVTELLGVSGDVALGLSDLSLDGLVRLDSERLDQIPLQLGGTLASPKLTPDIGEALKQEGGRRLMDLLNRGTRKSDESDDGG